MPSHLRALEIIEKYDGDEMWGQFLRSEDKWLALDALKFLHDHGYGKPRQAVDVSGGIVHAHTTYRNPKLAALSPEELKALDTLTRKLALPAPDAPHNQTKSDAATNAIEVECEDIQAGQLPENGCKIEITETNEQGGRGWG